MITERYTANFKTESTGSCFKNRLCTQVLVHVSTTYCNTDREVIEEQVYPAVADWRKMIALAEDQSNNELETNPEKLVTILR